MATPHACPHPGRVASLILDDLVAGDPTLTQAAIARRLGVDGSLPSHWRSGAKVMAVEWLPHLARIYGAYAVYGELLARAGCAIVRLPECQATGTDLSWQTLVLTGAVGEVARALAAARETTSPGGAAFTDEERQAIDAALEAAGQQVAQLRAELAGVGR